MAIVFALLMVLPFGVGLGLCIALLIAGPEVGMLPIYTMPVGIVAALICAVVPVYEARTRLNVMLIGTPAFYVVFTIIAR